MSQQYCNIHDRVKLEAGKCVACGDIPVIIKEPMGDKKRIKILLFGYSVFFAILAGLAWVFSN